MAEGDGGSSGVAVDPARSALQASIGNRNVTVTPADVAAAQKLYAELPAAERSPGALRALERDVAQNKYDAAITSAVAATRLRAPDAPIDPLIVKSLLYQESNMQANPNASGAYRGIAQIGAGEARASGLTVNGATDDRLDPAKAIGAVPKILERYDYALPYSKYVKEGLGEMPQGDDRAKFYLAAYNGGPGTVSEAMKLAAADGKNPLEFQNLLAQPGQPIESSPLYRAIDTVLRKDAPSIDPHEKYTEISSYANDIVSRAEAMHASVAQTPGHVQTPATPPAANTPAPHAPAPHAPAPHAGPTHAAQPNGTGAYDRATVRHEVGSVPLGTSRDLTDAHLTQRSLVDALGNLEAHAGVPIEVSVINTGHSTSKVDNPETHGHKAGYAADLYVKPEHDTPAARAKLIAAIGNDPYVTKVGLGGDYDTAANRAALSAAGKIVFDDNRSSHIHIQSEISPERLAHEEAGDRTPRPHAGGAPHVAPHAPAPHAAPASAAAPGPAVASSDQDLVNARILAAAESMKGMSTRDAATHHPELENGNLACAYSVNKVLGAALGRTYGTNTESVTSVVADLQREGTRIPADQIRPGDIAVRMPGQGEAHGHIGFVVAAGAKPEILSNSSTRGAFDSVQTPAAFGRNYAGHGEDTVEYFRIDPKSVNLEHLRATPAPASPDAAPPGHATLPAAPANGAPAESHVRTDYTAPKTDRILGETRDGKLVETKAELDAKNAILARAESDARRGVIDNVRFVGNGQESAREIARQNEKLWQGIERNLPLDGNPPLPPARRDGYAQNGTILSVENGVVTQDIGRHRTAEYAASDFSTPPTPGTTVTVQYRDGAATAVPVPAREPQQLQR